MSSSIHTSLAGEQDRGQSGRGQLKVFLGYAAGVGKTYHMLEEAQPTPTARKGYCRWYFEPHGRKDTIAKSDGLEIVPRRMVLIGAARSRDGYHGDPFTTPWYLCCRRISTHQCAWLRALQTLGGCTGLAGCRNRCDDEYELQHLESLNDQVFQITVFASAKPCRIGLSRVRLKLSWSMRQPELC